MHALSSYLSLWMLELPGVPGHMMITGKVLTGQESIRALTPHGPVRVTGISLPPAHVPSGIHGHKRLRFPIGTFRPSWHWLALRHTRYGA